MLLYQLRNAEGCLSQCQALETRGGLLSPRLLILSEKQIKQSWRWEKSVALISADIFTIHSSLIPINGIFLASGRPLGRGVKCPVWQAVRPIEDADHIG